ncbi:hypothetical protein PV383_19815 [Streptomyces caniscabiei]|uniref:REase associating with pPIWI RE domain-containing protein n=1 Tax=Streptomyces caniscabiei TaxID=2746961 RepID=A0ABU4MRL4_9ACTN|nr:hypothetical protein [Streptomyces caniscabiei]MBE4758366.1 hypothetical protein [Streptomyces caniscabiei]MBE4788457.1 hypothetical protein [Streptomyces caniscabiei]MDX2986403.1 hypothetical protein [Streptomyces caniscabiei]MDX3039407.1 hypothetical protein [Streptomyces caniscabiei]
MTDQPSIEAIPTTYGGTTFRSRLEADWAATLDANGIRWEYEPETITLPSGTVYIPDFWLPELGTWIEAKGHGIPRVEKTIELARTRACHCDGDCSCQWPGGELVILGRESLPPTYQEPGRRPPYGYANWETPYGPSAYCISCLKCDRTQWITLRRPWRCRACGHSLEKRPAHRAVDRKLRFVEGSAGDLGPAYVTEETLRHLLE